MQRFARFVALVWVAISLVYGAVVLADDRDVARAWFEQGVGHASRQEWPQAVDALERSRVLDERVPTLFNLMLAYDALDRPLDVARTVRLFLTRADPGRHQTERARALELEAKAYGRLARVNVQTKPSGTQLLVDGVAPVLAGDSHTVLMTPGKHELECAAEGHERQRVAIEVAAGERRVIDVVLAASITLERVASPAETAVTPETASISPTLPAAPTQPVRNDSSRSHQFASWRQPVSRAFAAVGAATWIGAGAVLGAAYGRANKIENRDSSQPGFLTATDDYQRMSRAVVPLSLVASGVLATAAGAWPRQRRWLDWVAAGAGLALVAVGVTVAASQPPPIPGTGLDQPRRQLGVFVAASGAPLLAFPFGKPAP